MNPYAKSMAQAVIDNEEAALRPLLDNLMEHGIVGEKKTFYLTLLRHVGIAPEVYLTIPPSIDIIDLDWLINAVTEYQVIMVTSNYHAVRKIEGLCMLSQLISFSEVRPVLKNVSTSILQEFMRVYKDDPESQDSYKEVLAEYTKRLPTGKK